jgi:hypothetical protein
LQGVSEIGHGGSKNMNSHAKRQSAVRGHLRLAASVSAEIRFSPQEVRAMSRVAVLLRRRAARLPEDSLLRAELMETAEYYATGADQASTGHLHQVA